MTKYRYEYVTLEGGIIEIPDGAIIVGVVYGGEPGDEQIEASPDRLIFLMKVEE